LNNVINEFYESLHNTEHYESDKKNKAEQLKAGGIPFRMYISHFIGGKYVYDKV
jgi:hypothetical protein